MVQDLDAAGHLLAMFRAYEALRQLGWTEANYAHRDPEIPLLLIEAGSTGVHRGWRDTEGNFWIEDDVDVWPSHPILFKEKK